MSENTTFSFLDRQYTLVRHPANHQHKTLQAWDSADELLIEHMTASPMRDGGKLIILNDDFGMLGCWFAEQHPHWFSDSWIAHCSLADNLSANAVAAEYFDDHKVKQPVVAHDSLARLPDDPNVVLIKLPRTLALLQHQLIALSQVVSPETRVIAAGKVKTVTRGVLDLFEKYIGRTTTSLAKKKSRLIFSSADSSLSHATHKSPYPTRWDMRCETGKVITISNHANVFSRQSLDIGARVMLEHMKVRNGERVIDLGCGNGVLGLNALAQSPTSHVTFVDESFMALRSARENVIANFPELIEQCEFIPSNCLDALLKRQHPPVDKVICNPPFHQLNAITDHIAWQMFNDAKALLNKSGHLLVVGNRHLDYHIKLKRIFGGVNVIGSHQKFVILSAAKR